MDADPALVRAKLVPLCHLGLPLNLVAEGPDARFIRKANFLHAIYLCVLDFEPTDISAHFFLFAVAVLEAHLGQFHLVGLAHHLCDVNRLALLIELGRIDLQC